MASSKKKFLRGKELFQALTIMNSCRRRELVKWIIGDISHHVPIDQAILIVRCSSYEGKHINGRIYFIREIDDRRKNTFDSSFRDGRAMLQFTPITRKTIDLWDQHFANSVPVQVP